MNKKHIILLFSFLFCILQAKTSEFYERPITVVITSYNNANWYKKNLGSVFNQNYENYKVVYVDDCSPDGTADLVEQYVRNCGQEHRFALIRNDERMFKMYNVYHAIHEFCDDEDIVIELDGDDWLAHNNVFEKLNAAYADSNVWLTYGSYREYPSGGVGLCRMLPNWVVLDGSYRGYSWVTSHLRTFYAWLFKMIKKEDFLHEGMFIKATTDFAQMFPMLEMAGGGFEFIKEILHIYNRANCLNISKTIDEYKNRVGAYNRSKQKYKKLEVNDLERLSLCKKAFGGWSIDKALFNFVRDLLSKGATVLELGSGWASGKFSEHYTVYSVEHAKQWLGRYNTNYIYAPIKNGWYDVAVLKGKLPVQYDLILVDGPPGVIGRGGFYKNLDLFNTNVPIIFDDTHRKAEYDLMINVANALGRDFSVVKSEGKTFGVIMPN